MAKNELLGGALWDAYSQKVADRMNNPRNLGQITQEEADKRGGKLIVADYGAESCGDAVVLYWLVKERNNKIMDAKFRSFGCGTAIASSDVMVDLCKGKTVDEAIKITNIDVEMAMRDHPDTPAVPGQKMHCSVMAYDVIKKAASIYKGVDMESLETEVIICECARVSLGTIQDAIKINKLETIEEVTNYTKAGGYCKSCIRPGGHEKKDTYLVDILQDVQAQISNGDENSKKEDFLQFVDMTIVQKIKAIESTIDENIRPMLMMDGGDLDIIDIKESESNTDIFIRYLGACSGCASSSTGTLYAIEGLLKDRLDESIRIFPV